MQESFNEGHERNESLGWKSIPSWGTEEAAGPPCRDFKDSGTPRMSKSERALCLLCCMFCIFQRVREKKNVLKRLHFKANGNKMKDWMTYWRIHLPKSKACRTFPLRRSLRVIPSQGRKHLREVLHFLWSQECSMPRLKEIQTQGRESSRFHHSN